MAKTILGVIPETHGYEDFQIINLATEYFGTPAKVDRNDGIVWLSFTNKTFAREFKDIIRLQCINENEEEFK